MRQGRTYFDSGDFALSKARKSSDIGSVETGKEHPVREQISQPGSAAPGSSNFMHTETSQYHETGLPTDAKPSSRLHGETASQNDAQLAADGKV